MTKDTISETAALKALLSETADHQILAEMLGFVADRLMALDVDQLCGAGSHERSVERMNHRNGYRPRRWETRAGAVDVQIPKLRKGTYFPEFLEPRRASEKAMTAVIQEAYIQGVSTRSVDDLVKAMGMTGISKSQVSRLCVEIDERVDAFLDRPLEGEWPYVWLDATYVKVRRSGRIVSVAAIVAVAVNTDGRREVLGIAIQPSEAEVFWDEFLRSLADRGLRGVKLIIADEHKGLKGAAAKVLGATVQRCRVGPLKNANFRRQRGVVRPRMPRPPWTWQAALVFAIQGCRSAATTRHANIKKGTPRAVASRLRLTAAAVRNAWMRMLSSPRRTARASPCQVFASPWKPSARQR